MVFRKTERIDMSIIIYTIFVILSLNALFFMYALFVYILKSNQPLILDDNDPELIWQREQMKKDAS